jgi:hypothetical protein
LRVRYVGELPGQTGWFVTSRLRETSVRAIQVSLLSVTHVSKLTRTEIPFVAGHIRQKAEFPLQVL